MTLFKLKKKLHKITDNLSEKDKKIILKAYELAEKVHHDQKRKSGSPFIVHPLSVAFSLWHQFHDVDLTVAAILHDTLEDGENIEAKEIYKNFGKNIGFIVDALNKKSNKFFGKKKVFNDKIERIIWASLKDIRVLILKLADRTNNLKSLEFLPSHKQVRMAFETQAIYFPFKDICDDNSIKKIDDNFKKFLNKNKLKTPKEIKKYLNNIFFADFNQELFKLVYDNTKKIIWKIEDLTWFEQLIKDKEFSKSIEILNIDCKYKGEFSTSFVFKKGHIIKSPGRIKAISIKE